MIMERILTSSLSYSIGEECAFVGEARCHSALLRLLMMISCLFFFLRLIENSSLFLIGS